MAAHWLAVLSIGFILDFMIGDPHGLWHPVQGIGRLIQITERLLRRMFSPGKKSERIAGGILVITVILVSAGTVLLIFYLLASVNKWLFYTGEVIVCWQMLAAKSLKTESMKVCTALQEEGLLAGRKAVSMIVGRDTEYLTEEGVIKAAVETVAENTSDGVTAPLFYMILFGPLGGVIYKAINTMDSMIGYKNDTYRFFGTCAARLDDLANYIPARLSALFMILATPLLHMNGRQAWDIYQRDRKNHKSPNAAQTEAVMAGALEVRLAGDAWYFGELHKKPAIGDAVRPIEREDIRRACHLEYVSVILSFAVMVSIKLCIVIWI